MRVISGKLKGRRLTTPKDNAIRPTTDRVKEAIFSIIDSHFAIENAVVADLFSGTGNLGIEAVSRGARICYFCDSSKDSIKLTRENILHCKGCEENSVVYAGDYVKTLSRIKANQDKVDIFILDPPYNVGLCEKAISQISNLDLLSEMGLIMAEHGKDEKLPEVIGKYKKVKEKKYGTVVLSIYVC